MDGHERSNRPYLVFRIAALSRALPSLLDEFTPTLAGADLLDDPGDFINPDPQALLVSAITGDNLESLVQEIINHLGEHARRGK